MSFRLVTEHENATLKEIAESEGIEYSHGDGYYQLTKKESISSSKQLILWVNKGQYETNPAQVRSICGVAMAGDVSIKPSDVPHGSRLFVQSTSSNRKIPTDAAVLFRVEGGNEEDMEDDEQPAKKMRAEAEYAIKFDELLHEVETKAGEIDDEDLKEFFNVPIATKWNDCDTNVPKKLQLASLWQLCQLSQVDWTKFEIQTHDTADNSQPAVIKYISAQGTLNLFPKADDEEGDEEEEEDENSRDVNVRVEYREVVKEGGCYPVPLFIYMTSIGNIWGCAHGVRSELPFVVTNEIQQTSSDDGNGFRQPVLIPAGEGITNNQRFESILGNMIVNYNLACRNWN